MLKSKVIDLRNLYGVSKRQWNKWNDNQKFVFNSLYKMMKDNQSLFKHPEGPLINHGQWKTVAWNASFMAADFYREFNEI